MARGRRTGSLGFKLFLSYVVVIIVGIGTLVLTAGAFSPTFFAAHMGQMGPGGMAGMMGLSAAAQAEQHLAALDHTLNDAFRAALLQGLLVAGTAALAAALMVSGFVSHRIVQPVRRLAAASDRLARGHYAERVPVGGGDELDELANSFNEMAGALEGTEHRRLELIGDVAHELRTPVATLQGNLEGLLDGVVEPSERTWAKLQDEVGRLRRLIDDLQELSRAEARQIPLHLQPVSPQGIAHAAVERLTGQFEEKGLEFSVDAPAGLPAVLADRDRAIQVLTNLLTNALRYTPAPGSVRLTVERSGESVQFRVADSGVGISAEDLPHVFERFYRVDKSRSRMLGGSGIGLTIAGALVQAMGGRIWAESSGHGRGSTFGFTLPVAKTGSSALTKS
ncbi:MAG: HAMP domain-containing protein [Chloroflexota bacterium]|nr:HAMP domain-containing protein [Chloroflexota bacterium]